MMEKLIDSEALVTDAPAIGRILIVDDDPVVAGMLGTSLAAAGYEIDEVNSGEEALAHLEKLAGSNSRPLPDIVFLDIEMGMGIDGYETCRRLRAADDTHNLPVIFLSAHDEPDDRLRAYDAGGSDFMAKPFMPDEVLRKARLAIDHQRQQQALKEENRSQSEMVTSVLAGLDDSGIIFKFSRGALGCRTLRGLAALTIESMGAFGIKCHVQLRTPGEILTLTPQGPASPLEESVIEISRNIDRIFSFHQRLIINFDSVSLLVTDMPKANDALCGRIRDHGAVIAELAELAVGNINLRTDAVLRADDLRQLAQDSRIAIEELRKGYHDLQMAILLEFQGMTDYIEGMYVNMGLTGHQESIVSDTVRNAVDSVLTMFEGSVELERNFAGIVEGLTRAGEYKVSQEDEVTSSFELF
ncbi:response regulator [Propionivibrio sp.]|uniref:response regulator n=1 Tax=Propionivibrio sp. TaxID=2212460 RepID=UPI003BF30AFE